MPAVAEKRRKKSGAKVTVMTDVVEEKSRRKGQNVIVTGTNGRKKSEKE